MVKTNILITLLIIFILPVFTSNYQKYSRSSYEQMMVLGDFEKIGKEYTDYFSDGLDKIDSIGIVAQAATGLLDNIGKAITLIKDAVVNVYNFIIQIPRSIGDVIRNIFKNDKPYEESPPMAGGDGWESPDWNNGLI